jgi:DNA end-binding protein Ku
VAWSDLVKGYEVAPGQFVAVTEDDFKTAAVERSRSIDITEFVPVGDIDARYWDTPYALEPSKGAEHAYTLLAKALGESRRAGIAKYVMRQRQHLAAVHEAGGLLALTTLRFKDDLVERDARVPTAKLAAREVALASQLVNGMAADWDPSRHADDYVPSLMKFIDAKGAGVAPKAARARAQRATNVVDLVERLKQSLEAAKTGTGKSPRAAKVQKKAATRRGRKRSAA